MKRVLLHIAFWFTYGVQSALLEFMWLSPALSKFSDAERWVMCTYTALALLIPKLIFTYFVMYVAAPNILQAKGRIAWTIVQVVLLLLFCIFLYRIILLYYLNPVVFDNLLSKMPIWNPPSVFFTMMDIGFVSGVAVCLKLFRVQLEGNVREKNLMKEKLETELKFLRNQTNPHFLFNTLNNIYALARKKSDDTPEVVMKLSKLLRFMLYESKKDLVTMAEEVKMVEDYLELERIRYNERLTVVFQKDIDNGAHPVAPLLLLPFIENAFKHGVSETRFDSFVHITIRLSEGILNFTIENNKDDNGSRVINDNIGLSNVRRQLELMYENYNLQVLNEPSLFKVHLTINLNSHAKL